MELYREKEYVSQFHYDARNFQWEEVNGAPTTKVVGKTDIVDRRPEDQRTIVSVTLDFMVVMATNVVSGRIMQVSHILNRVLGENETLTEAEMMELQEPCMDMLRRLTYEVTEIALDEPGIALEEYAENVERP